MPQFVQQSLLNATADEVLAFHDDPQVLRRLTMPPLILQVLRDDRMSLTTGEIEFRLWFGPLPVRWLARHEAGPIRTSFKDVQLAGPMAVWEHEHLFEDVSGGVLLIDRIRIEHRRGLAGLLTRLVFDGPMLRLAFAYRHWRTRRALQAERIRDQSAPEPERH